MFSIIRKLARKGGVKKRERTTWIAGADNLLPVYPAQVYLDRHREHLHAIRALLGMPDEEYEQKVLGPVRRYFELVGELPASRHHHHRKPGGLARHGIEVSHIALRLAEERHFVVEGSPERRRRLSKAYSMLLFYAGLCHDPGKVVTMFRVSDEERKGYWNPRKQSLYGWACERDLEAVWYEWIREESRNWRISQLHHSDVNAALVFQILGAENLDWASEPILDGVPISVSDLLLALVSEKEHEAQEMAELAGLIKEADKESVVIDMASDPPATVDPSSLAQLILEEIVTMYNDDELQVNRRGGYLWQLNDGLYVYWDGIFPIIRARLAQRMVNLPPDPVVAANHLVMESLAMATLRGDRHSPLHWIHPEHLPYGIEAVKLNNPERFFRQYPLARPLRDLENEEVLREVLEGQSQSKDGGSRQAEAGPETGDVPPQKEGDGEEAVPVDRSDPPLGETAPTGEETSIGEARQAGDRGSGGPPVGEELARADVQEELRRKLLARSEGGRLILKILDLYRRRQIRVGEHFGYRDGRFVLAYPEILEPLDGNRSSHLRTLVLDGLIQPRPDNPAVPVHRIGGRQVLVLEEETGALMAVLMDAVGVELVGARDDEQGEQCKEKKRRKRQKQKKESGRVARQGAKKVGAGHRKQAGPGAPESVDQAGGGCEDQVLERKVREAVVAVATMKEGRATALMIRVREELQKAGVELSFADLKKVVRESPYLSQVGGQIVYRQENGDGD